VPGSLTYLDSSALVKLVVREPETAALRGFLQEHPFRVSSRIAEVEVVRAVNRVRSSSANAALSVMRRIGLIEPDPDILRVAARLEPKDLRTLDAIHLASALSLGPDLDILVAYDVRLADAARAAGIAVASPG
jgi:predicted nucleic acid-binding protein